MSVWRIASKPTAKPSLSSLKPTKDESAASKSLNALTKWLPAEAVAGYAALVAAAQPVLVLLTSTVKNVTDGMWVRAGLSVPVRADAGAVGEGR